MEEQMNLQQSTTIPEIHETIVMLRELSADEKVRQEAFYREKRLHDEASALGHARREGFAEGYAQGFAEGYAKVMAEGMTEFKSEVAERLRKMDVSEEQIREAIEE